MTGSFQATLDLPRWAPLCAVLFALASMPAAALENITAFGDNPGNLSMFLHRPAGAGPGLPLVVALHGCTQQASSFDDETGLVELSNEVPFLLLLPEQKTENMARRCFRWYDTRDNRPGQGESASILAMIDHLVDTEGADPDRVFILGLSAGGAMTAVMIANYPDRFAGGAVIAGLPYDCNRPAGVFDFLWGSYHYNPFAPDGADASYACGILGYRLTDRDAEDWASYVIDAKGAVSGTWPLISLWQGTGDDTVDPGNLRELTEQWTSVQGLDSVADETQTLGDAVREIYHDAGGVPRLETWSLSGFPHAVAVDPDGAAGACGSEAPFVADGDICAVRRIATFWQLE